MKCDELKAFNMPRYAGEFTMHEVYLKSDVDAAIDELKAEHHKERHEYIKMIAELKADYKEACDRLQTANLIKDEQLAATRHSKYKRCLAMAKECVYGEIKLKRVKMRDMNNHQFWQFDNDYWQKWNNRWLELAEKVKGGEVMEENTTKFEIKIDPLDFHPGLKGKMTEFESLIRMESPGKKLKEKIEKDLKSRFCHCCFFGHVEGELMGEPLCKECAKILYGFDANEERPSIKKIDPYYQLWYRRQRALPVFEAYLHAEVERYKLEQKLAEEK